MTKNEIREALEAQHWPARVIDEMFGLVGKNSVKSIEEFHALVREAQQKKK